MSSDILVVAALGRPFTLGALYDARQDNLIPGFTLWNNEVLQESTVDCPQPSSAFEIIASDSLDDKSSLMDIEASLKASFLGGLIEVGGSAKYMNDTKKYKNQSRVTLQYKATTNFKQLMTTLGNKQIEYSNLFDSIQATHVVIGILYGANAFFVFDSDKVRSSNVQEIQGSMEAVIKKIPSVEISGQGAVTLTSDESGITNNLSCKFHGDVFLKSNPTTFEDAVQTYQKLPEMIGKQNTVPMTVWLVPLTNFYPEVPQVVAGGSTTMLRKAHNILEAIRQLDMRCNDCLEDKIVQLFPQIKKKLCNFQDMCNEYTLSLRQTIAKKLMSVRSGEEEESSLLKVFEDNLRSPFNVDSLNMWLESEEREINVVRSCMDIMEGAKAKAVSSKSEMIREMLDSKVQHTLCFVFTFLVDYDDYLSTLLSYLDSGVGNPKKLRPSANYWFTSDDVPEEMRELARQFASIAEGKVNRTVRFLVTAIENRKQVGAGLHYYRDGILMTKDFKMSDWNSVQDRRDLLWYDCELSLDPDTAHPFLALSEGNKKCVSGVKQTYDDHPERFQLFQQVLCTQALSGRHYWELEWSGYGCAGVTYGGIQRKILSQHSLLGFNQMSWAFDYIPGQGYRHYHDSKSESVAVSTPGFKKLGVYLDWPAGILSFYMVSARSVTRLHTFKTKFNEAVYPAFLIGCSAAFKNGEIKLL